MKSKLATVLTAEQILALAPDDSSAKAAKGLLAPAKWPTLGHDTAAIWGECQGSGSKPYQVIIEVGGPAFKCSCPSRKFPCKHGLALYLLLAQKAEAFKDVTPPAWVTEWLSARQQRAEKQAEKKAVQADAPPADPAATAKREAKRLERMLTGARDLERWMADLIRQGMADLPAKPAAFWREAAARLVDAQAGGLAVWIRHLESVVQTGGDWQPRALLLMGRLQLLTTALQRLNSLPAQLQHDVRTSAGWPTDKEEVSAHNDKVEDAWQVLGVSHDESDQLWERRVWLRGRNTQRQALLLDFSHGGRRFETVFVPGMTCQAQLAFYPSASPLRALIDAAGTHPASDASMTERSTAPAAVDQTWDAALVEVADRLAQNPWLQRLPLLAAATPVRRNQRWFLGDSDSREIPLRVADDDGWQLLALSGGRPLILFGEWLGDQLRPLAAWRVDDTHTCWTEGITHS